MWEVEDASVWILDKLYNNAHNGSSVMDYVKLGTTNVH